MAGNLGGAQRAHEEEARRRSSVGATEAPSPFRGRSLCEEAAPRRWRSSSSFSTSSSASSCGASAANSEGSAFVTVFSKFDVESWTEC